MAMATISHGGKVLHLRTNPNSVRWTYKIKKKVEQTYGGRVVQLLSSSIDDLTVTADAGRGGWAYIENQVAPFFRDMLFDQREGGAPGVFSFPSRGWEMKVYALSFPYKDQWDDVRREFTMSFKVQEDVTGVVSTDTLAVELSKIKNGVGYAHNEYNDPDFSTEEDKDEKKDEK